MIVNRSRPSPLAGQAGYTLIETVVVVAMLSILTGIAVIPLLQDALPDGRSKSATEQVMESMRLARQNAISNTSTYQVTFPSGQVQVTCADDVALPGDDCNRPNRPPDSTELLGTGVSVTAAPATIAFSRLGVATAATVTVTYPGGNTWEVKVNIPGRVQACTPTCP